MASAQNHGGDEKSNDNNKIDSTEEIGKSINNEDLANNNENTENLNRENIENRGGAISRKNENHKNKNWVNEKLITASISHITRFSEEKLAMDLEKRNLWKDVTGLSISGNRKIMEIEFRSRKSVEELLVNPLNTHQRSLAFREINSKRVTVSLLGVPLGYPMQDIVDELSCYGDLVTSYQISKEVYGRRVPSGTRIIKFKELLEPIPKYLNIGGRSVRAIYTGQDAHITEWENQQSFQEQPVVINEDHDDHTYSKDKDGDKVEQNEEEEEEESDEDDDDKDDDNNGAVNEDGDHDKTKNTDGLPNDEDPKITEVMDYQLTDVITGRKRNNEDANLTDDEMTTKRLQTDKEPILNIEKLTDNDIKQSEENEIEKSENDKNNSNNALPELPKKKADDVKKMKIIKSIKKHLKPKTCNKEKMFKYFDGCYENFDQFFNIVRVLSHLIDDEIYMFLGHYYWYKYGKFTNNRQTKDKELNARMIDSWKYMETMEKSDRSRKYNEYHSAIQQFW